MSSADLHQILIPYLYASGAMGLIVGGAALLLRRDGARQKADQAAGDAPSPDEGPGAKPVFRGR